MFKFALCVLVLFFTVQGLPREERLRRPHNIFPQRPIIPVTKKTKVENCGFAPLAGNSTLPKLSLTGGTDVTPPHSFPWVARVIYCAILQVGALISDEWVLTSAQAIGHNGFHSDQKWMYVILGVQDSSYPEDSWVKIYSYDAYSFKDDPVLDHRVDLALVQLSEKITFNDYIQPICLPAYSDPELEPGTVITLTGWGPTEPGDMDIITLQMVNVAIIDQETCIREYGDDAWDGTICTSGEGGKGPCWNDDGDPMNYKKEAGGPTYVRGVTSHGELRCGTLRPYIHTRITFFLDFISNVTGILIDP